jgi:hypothetical protein
MSFIFNNDVGSLARRVAMWLPLKKYWHASKWSSISFSHWQCPSYGDFSFPRLVGFSILSLRLYCLWQRHFSSVVSTRSFYLLLTWHLHPCAAHWIQIKIHGYKPISYPLSITVKFSSWNKAYFLTGCCVGRLGLTNKYLIYWSSFDVLKWWM